MIIEKRFPANVGMQQDTFLNNKQIDGRLYVYLQSISKPEKNSVGEYETRVEKKDIPIQFVICEKVQIKSPKTYRLHFKKLLETGYLIDSGSYYILPRKEDVFFNIPLDTIIFFRDTVKEDVIKTYIYLGQRNKYGLTQHRQYIFTKKELLQHLGLSNSSANLKKINNILAALVDFGFITFSSKSDGKVERLILTGFSLKYHGLFLEEGKKVG